MHHRGPLTIHQFPCLSDNYAFLVRDDASGKVATIDTPDADAIAAEADRLGWPIDFILNTHWHPDHAGGNAALAERFGCRIIAPGGEGDKISTKDEIVSGGDTVLLGETVFEVIDVPGHTLGHIAYHVPAARTAFVGDTVFSLGCGRMFEGTPDMFWQSLLRLRRLPDDTMLFCAHEYTAANARFALSIDADNPALQRRAEEVRTLRDRGEPTVPVLLGEELRANPFLRADDAALAAAVGLPGAPADAVFAEIRRRKDSF